SSAEIDSYQLAAYASGDLGPVIVRGGLIWSWNDIETSRAVIFPGFAEQLGASYNGNTKQVFGEAALPLTHSNIAIEPFAGLAWVGVDADGFTETGGDAALASNGASVNVGDATLGVRAASSLHVAG